jgi:Ca2+-binding EF-hand superfamily protein
MTRNRLIATLWSLILCLVSVDSVFAQKAAVPKQQDKSAVASENVKALLLLMDTDKNGKISKQEWMKFMEAEFDRLDKDKSGELDPQELRRSGFSVQRPRSADVGK